MAWQVWQNVQLLASISQFVLYLAGFANYKSRLEDLADELTDRSDEQFTRYQELRNKDPEFFDYYNTLPDYEICESNIKRSRGAAAARYGEKLRGSLPTINGYTPLQRVAVTNLLGADMAMSPAMKRTQTLIAERARQDDYELQRWQAIVAAPTNSAATNDVGNIISASFKSLSAFGQGVNSAGVSIGTQLFNR